MKLQFLYPSQAFCLFFKPYARKSEDPWGEMSIRPSTLPWLFWIFYTFFYHLIQTSLRVSCRRTLFHAVCAFLTIFFFHTCLQHLQHSFLRTNNSKRAMRTPIFVLLLPLRLGGACNDRQGFAFMLTPTLWAWKSCHSFISACAYNCLFSYLLGLEVFLRI